MASLKLRSVNTGFWSDAYIENLDPIEKLLFLYLITNPSVDLCGVYKITLKRIAFEIGIDRDMVAKLIKRFEDDGKAFYFEGYIILPNYRNHQRLTPIMEDVVVKELAKLPEEVLNFYHTLSDRYPHSVDTKILVEDPPQTKTKVPPYPSGAIKCTSNLIIEDRMVEFREKIRNFNKERMILDDDEENEFIAYWTEKNEAGTKFRKEAEKYFDVAKRMATWKRNCLNNKKNFLKKPVPVTGTGRVVNDKDNQEFKKVMDEAKKKIETGGLYNPNNDPEYLKIMGRVS